MLILDLIQILVTLMVDGYTYGSTEAMSFLAEAYNFQVSEIEVFQRI